MVVVMLQWYGGAFKSEFGGYPDEAGHYITGLMVRDYIASLNLKSPIKFAEDYYIHYPKVAIGHWPPFFYIVQTIWTLLFSPSRFSILLLMALLTMLLASTVYWQIKNQFGSKTGIIFGLLLIALPLIQTYSKMVMTEILLTLLSFWAALYFGRFLDSERWQEAAGFGICATMAILTKGNGLALALVPPLALLFSRRWHLIRRPSFWLPLVIVLIFCAPLQWITMDIVRNGWQESAPTLKFTTTAIRYYSYHLIKIAGIGLSLFIAIGFIMQVVKPYRCKQVEGKWAAIGAFLLSVLLFHCIIPCGQEDRHLIMAIPALLMFLAAGLASIIESLPLRSFANRPKALLLALVMSIVFAVETFRVPKKAFYGFGKVAQQLLATSDFRHSVFLVSSDSRGEGMFISEVAMQENRPGHIVLRASKSLSLSRWDGTEYESFYNAPEEMMSYLKEIPVGIVIFDKSAQYQSKHHHLLQETLEEYPQHWELLGNYTLTRKGIEHHKALWVYRQIGHETQPVGTIKINMHNMLEKTFEKKIK